MWWKRRNQRQSQVKVRQNKKKSRRQKITKRIPSHTNNNYRCNRCRCPRRCSSQLQPSMRSPIARHQTCHLLRCISFRMHWSHQPLNQLQRKHIKFTVSCRFRCNNYRKFRRPNHNKFTCRRPVNIFWWTHSNGPRSNNNSSKLLKICKMSKAS